MKRLLFIIKARQGWQESYLACVAALEDIKEGSELLTTLSVPDSRWIRIVDTLKACGVSNKKKIKQFLEQIYKQSGTWSAAQEKINPNRLDADVIASLAIILNSVPELECLNFWGNNIGAMGVKTLVANFGIYPHLTHIDFSWNGICDHGALALLSEAPKLSSLQKVYLRENQIKEEIVLKISESLKKTHPELLSFLVPQIDR